METESEVTTDGGIDQSGMESDYMSQYQLVDDNGTPIDEGNTEEPVQELKPEPKTQAQPAQPENVNPTEDYTKHFYQEDGTLDVTKALQFFNGSQEPKQAAPVQQPVQAPIPPQAPAQEPQTEPQDPHSQMRENAMAALKLQRYYMQQGLDFEQAMQRAEQDIEAHLKDYQVKSEMQKIRDEFTKKEEAFRNEIKNERELAIAGPKAQENLTNACAKYANGMPVKTLLGAIWNPDFGGEFFLSLFNMHNPDKSGLVGPELQKTMEDWFTKTAAKDQGFVNALAINALSRLQMRVFPDMIKLSQQNAVNRTATQNRNKPGPSNLQQPAAHKPVDQSPEQKNLDMFFHNTPRDSSGRTKI